MNTRFVLWTAAVVLAALGVTAARADDEDAARDMAERLLQQGAVDFLTDRELEFKDDSLSGTVKSVDPKERVKIEITDFEFVPGRVMITYKLGARFRFDGKITVEKTEHEESGTAHVGAEIDLVANYRLEGERLVIDSKILDLDDVKVDVVELEPNDLPGGTEAAAKLAKHAIEEHADELIREANDWQAKQNLQ